jgi:hypothetical protein
MNVYTLTVLPLDLAILFPKAISDSYFLSNLRCHPHLIARSNGNTVSVYTFMCKKKSAKENFYVSINESLSELKNTNCKKYWKTIKMLIKGEGQSSEYPPLRCPNLLIRWKYDISQRLVKNEIQRTSDFIVYFAMHLVTNVTNCPCPIIDMLLY